VRFGSATIGEAVRDEIPITDVATGVPEENRFGVSSTPA